ncbi:MAG: diacylglycerol kinase family lipid kinase [Chloroflexi bacterium]|nr:diacylglycerol kinase family lipid kinase [Chloroflexota bacterium]MQC26390.1 diacylglycerol kinase family lipid kinase [Chloroflexota bacterium]
MPKASKKNAPEIVLVFNPHAGSAHRDELQRLLAKYFDGRQVELCETKESGGLRDNLQPWIDKGVHLVIAAGGDGTVSEVASALVNTDVPLGILPLGTGNALARELGLPIKTEEAAAILSARYGVRRLDVMQVAGKIFTLAVSVGLSAKTMRRTRDKNKRRFGRIAYIWPFFLSLFGLTQYDFELEIDGRKRVVSANEVIVVNAGIIGYKALRWGPDVQPDDGHLNICFVRAKTLLDYLDVFWRLFSKQNRRDTRLNCVEVYQSVRINTPGGLAIQGDGDLIGETPVEITLHPAALKVAVPLKNS